MHGPAAGAGAGGRAATLARHAAHIRRTSLQMVHRARLGHPGGDFSAADILAVLYFDVLHVDPAVPRRPDRDRFILSKGHCSAALYAVLAHAGFFPEAHLLTYMQPLSPFNGHPDRNKVPGVEANTGPLGHGLPIAVGTALAATMDGAAWRTFALTGDGELQEGSNWEAAMSAGTVPTGQPHRHRRSERAAAGRRTERTVSLEPLRDRWRSFGWGVADVDGHDVAGAAETCWRRPPRAGPARRASSPTLTRARACRSWQTGSSGTTACRRMSELARALAEIDASVLERGDS